MYNAGHEQRKLAKELLTEKFSLKSVLKVVQLLSFNA